MPEELLAPLDDKDLDFQFRVGTSLLEEFATSHTPADVLRELVQNEYDAGGTELKIGFGVDALVVRGNGRTIDSAGWNRLSVMLGTGLIAGFTQRVEPKVNGIGSKNFGLRSLFLFGDRIHVMSGGCQTVLDRTRGALANPLPHPESQSQPGVTLIVPYRQVSEGPLRAFDEQFEDEALGTITSELAPTIVKLAHPGRGKNLGVVVLHSARLGHQLRWRQTARADKALPSLLRRTARVDLQGAQLADLPEVIREVEYQHVVTPPAGLDRPEVPGYFRVPGGRIRLAISLRAQRGRLDLGATGIFYYPIGAGRSRTGFPFSISAPFRMTEDRSQLTDPQISPWNAWLIEEAAAFAAGLLPDKLFPAFGPDSFLAFDPRGASSSTVPLLGEEIDRLLRTEACWPTQAKTRRTGRPVLVEAGSLVVPVNPALADFAASTLEPGELLHADMVSLEEIRALVTELGSDAFTVSSLVHLYCTSSNKVSLKTTLSQNEAARYFVDFPEELRNRELQLRFMAALDACRAELRDEHMKDLRYSPTAMTAAVTLDAPASLWIVDEALTGVVDSRRILHPVLTSCKVIPKLCRPFNFSLWAIETAERIKEGSASEEERDALLRYMRGRPALSQKAWAAVRHSPVLPDQRGEFCAPADMVSPSANGAGLVKSALHLVTSADETSESSKHLRFRTSLRGADLVVLARLVERGSVSPAVMRRALTRLQRLLTPAVLAKLKDIRFLETELGSVRAPTDAYIRSDRLVAVLGEAAPYATKMPVRLLQRLGCRADPRADDIAATLAKLRESGDHLSKIEAVYKALVTAFRQERRKASQLQDKPIISVGGRWEAPENCLVGRENRNTFLDAVTVLPEGLREVWVALGVPNQPTESHWRLLLVRVGELYGTTQQAPQRVTEALRRAYRNLDRLPEGLSSSTRCLLDDQRHLHSPAEAENGLFLFNDDPALASTARSANVPVAFADSPDHRVRQFLEAVGTRRLSAVAHLAGTEYGPEIRPNESIRVEATLARLKDPNFASAVAALASEVSGHTPTRTAPSLAARLARIERIIVVDKIRRQYNLAGGIVSVASDYDLRDDMIVLERVTSAHELRRSVADAVAVMADSSSLGDSIYFLLRSRSVREMQRELERRRVAWNPELILGQDASEDTDEPEGVDDELAASLADAISRSAIGKALSGGSGTSNTPPVPAPSPAPEPTPTPTPPPALPDLGVVEPLPAAARGTPSNRSYRSSGTGGSGSWSPRSQDESEYDRAVGRRGEEIVLNLERERVRHLGFPPERVVWTADSTPEANHDIKSVDDDGEDLWIEVKSTRGRNGQFRWPVAEFQLAVRARHHYMLYRVYEADTTAPSWACIRDPIGAFDAGDISLDLDRLSGDVGALEEHSV